MHEIVNIYLKIRGWDKMTKDWYLKNNVNYAKLCKEAKRLLLACGGNIEDAMWSVDKMKYKADKGHFNWTISTCLKYKLND